MKKSWKPCKTHEKIRLNPDYASSGIECDRCGIVFGNPKEEFPQVPAGLFDLVEVWSWTWADMSDRGVDRIGNPDYVFKSFHGAGMELVGLINQYYPCSCHDSTWKFFDRKTM